MDSNLLDLEADLNKLSLETVKVGYVFDERMLLHKDFKDNHVEKPERAMSIYMNLVMKGLVNKLTKLPSEEIDDENLFQVHDKKYLETVSNLRYEAKNKSVERKKNENKNTLCHDTYDNFWTYDSAKVSAGSLLSCVKAVSAKKVNHAFAIIRPPGHHANSNSCRGFCFYNNVAVSVNYLTQTLKLKVAIVDWDVHHGDGTQDIFLEQNNPLFISLHRYDNGGFYPHLSGNYVETGKGDGSGYTVNVPWNTFTIGNKLSSIGDDEYVYAFEKIVIPILEDYKPDVILVSSGFDAAENDPLGSMSLTPIGYAYMTHLLKKVCNKLVFALEGGYNLDSLSRCSESIIRTLLNEMTPFQNLLHNKHISGLNLDMSRLNSNYFVPSSYSIKQVNLIKEHLEPFWPTLKDVKVTTPKSKVFKSDKANVVNEILKLNHDFKKHILTIQSEDNYSVENLHKDVDIDFIKIKFGSSTLPDEYKTEEIVKYERRVNKDSRTITKSLGWRLEGIRLGDKRLGTKAALYKWNSKEGIFDVNNTNINTLIEKFMISKKFSKTNLIEALEEFASTYEKIFTEKGLDLYNVDLFIFPVAPIKEEVKTTKTKKDKPKMNFKLKLNGFKDYSIVKSTDNFIQGLRSFITFLNNIVELNF